MVCMGMCQVGDVRSAVTFTLIDLLTAERDWATTAAARVAPATPRIADAEANMVGKGEKRRG